MFLVQDSKTHSSIIGALKRTFSRSPIVINFLRARRIEEQRIKKDGSVSLVPCVSYICNVCGGKFNSNNIQVDHIESVIPLRIPSKHMSFDTIVSRLFCDESNLQILCKADHHKKSVAERLVRKEWGTKLKFVVYETVNKLTSKRYIGVHKCVDYDEVYLGSGKLLKQAVAKYGIGSFYRNILFVYDNADEAYSKEAELVNQNVVSDDGYYNLVVGGRRGSPEGSKGYVPVICHQTGEIFQSVSEAANHFGVQSYSISRVLDKADQPLHNLHFFRLYSYDSSVKVTFPSKGSVVVCLNNRTKYESVKDASDKLGLHYTSLRNALSSKDAFEYASLDGYFFLYEWEYEEDVDYKVSKRVVVMDGTLTFASLPEAANHLKKNSPNNAIAIGKAARAGGNMYGHSWNWSSIDVSIAG